MSVVIVPGKDSLLYSTVHDDAEGKTRRPGPGPQAELQDQELHQAIQFSSLQTEEPDSKITM